MAIRTVLHLELTDNCNFNCSFCKSVRRQNKATLDYDVALRCLDVMKDQTIHGIYLNSVQFNGSGEALLYPRLDEMIVEARKRFSMAEFVTNGSLLTEERIERLLNTDIDMIERGQAFPMSSVSNSWIGSSTMLRPSFGSGTRWERTPISACGISGTGNWAATSTSRTM